MNYSYYETEAGYKIEGKTNEDIIMAGGGTINHLKKEDSWVHSPRNFPNGTLIETDVDYSQDYGDQFLLEIKGNMYDNSMPLDAKIQGYIYLNGANPLLNLAGYTTCYYWKIIYVFNYNGKLCFWFPQLSYWQGFDVKLTVGYGGIGQGQNRVTNVSDHVDPVGTKRMSIYLKTLATQEYVQNELADKVPIHGDAVINDIKQFVGPYTHWALNGDVVNNARGFAQSLSGRFLLGTLNDKDLTFYRNAQEKIIIEDLKTTFNHSVESVGYISSGNVAVGDKPNILRINRQSANDLGVLSESNGWAHVNAAGFKRSGSDDSYVLTGGGGHDLKQKYIFGDNATGTIQAYSPENGSPINSFKPVKSGFYRPNGENNYGSLLLWLAHAQDPGNYGAGIAFDYAGTNAYLTGIDGSGNKMSNKKIWHSEDFSQSQVDYWKYLSTVGAATLADLGNYIPKSGGDLSAGGAIDGKGNLTLRQELVGGSATGSWWWNNAYNARIAGIGVLTTNGVLDYAYMGWGGSPWDSSTALIASDTLLRYKGYDVIHTGIFNPSNSIPYIGAISNIDINSKNITTTGAMFASEFQGSIFSSSVITGAQVFNANNTNTLVFGNDVIPSVYHQSGGSHAFQCGISTIPLVMDASGVSMFGAIQVNGETVATQNYVQTKIADLVASSPSTLDTLNELAQALGNDPNFATTVATQIGTKANKTTTISAGTGLSGGGDLSTDRTLSIDAGTMAKINHGETAYNYGNHANAGYLVDDGLFPKLERFQVIDENPINVAEPETKIINYIFDSTSHNGAVFLDDWWLNQHFIISNISPTYSVDFYIWNSGTSVYEFIASVAPLTTHEYVSCTDHGGHILRKYPDTAMVW